MWLKSQEENSAVINSVHSHGCKSEIDHANQNEGESDHTDWNKSVSDHENWNESHYLN